MKYMGIDYGTRNVGIALSDDEGTMAFPKDTLLNTSVLADDIEVIARNNNVAAIVLGESKDKDGNENPIMKKILAFKEALEAKGFRVYYENELYTSQAASRIPGREQSGSYTRLSKNDASAATLILQGYLDKHHGEN